MSIKAVYDSLEEVDERYKDLYEEREGKARLKKIDGAVTQADVDRLKTSLTKSRAEVKAAESKLKEYTGSADDIAAEMDALRDKENTPTQTQMRELNKLKKELEDSQSQVLKLNGTLGAHSLKDAFTKAASTQGVTKSALEDILLWGENLFTIKNGDVVHKDDTNTQTPSEWLEEQKSSGSREHWFEQSSGSGAQGSSNTTNSKSVKHFTKGTSNLTEMFKLHDENKDKAESLAKQAGHTSYLDALASHAKNNA